jgi:hypothetical protein
MQHALIPLCAYLQTRSSVTNFLVNLVAGLIAYTHSEHKPSLYLRTPTLRTSLFLPSNSIELTSVESAAVSWTVLSSSAAQAPREGTQPVRLYQRANLSLLCECSCVRLPPRSNVREGRRLFSRPSRRNQSTCTQRSQGEARVISQMGKSNLLEFYDLYIPYLSVARVREAVPGLTRVPLTPEKTPEMGRGKHGNGTYNASD